MKLLNYFNIFILWCHLYFVIVSNFVKIWKISFNWQCSIMQNFTRKSSDVHFRKIPCFEYNNCKSVSSRLITKRNQQLSPALGTKLEIEKIHNINKQKNKQKSDIVAKERIVMQNERFRKKFNRMFVMQ